MPISILLVSAEAVPYAKVGGLADVAGTLPRILKKLGMNVSLVLPRYKKINPEALKLRKAGSSFSVSLGGKTQGINVYEGEKGVYFLDNPAHFDRDNVYGEPDDFQRFVLFSKAVVKLPEAIGKTFNIFHCNDWQTAVVPLYLKQQGTDAKSVFTIHNLGYQGVFPKKAFSLLDLPDSFLSEEGLEFYGKVNLMKAGILFSDAVNTVSPAYAEEIQTKAYGEKMDGLLRSRKAKLSGILNGIDYEEWNPATDSCLASNFSKAVPESKVKNKEELLKECLLPAGKEPLCGMVSRLASQKGFAILAKALEQIMSLDIKMVILGTGEPELESRFLEFEKKYAKKLKLFKKFDNTLAHKIYAASDFFLMPSRYEPCGLGQMIALRYGTIPLVRKTGGLSDTIKEFDEGAGTGNGFLFEGYKPSSLVKMVKKALTVYEKKPVWGRLVKNAMSCDFSWEVSAQKYVELYHSLLNVK